MALNLRYDNSKMETVGIEEWAAQCLDTKPADTCCWFINIYYPPSSLIQMIAIMACWHVFRSDTVLHSSAIIDWNTIVMAQYWAGVD